MPSNANFLDNGSIFAQVVGVHSAMPEQVPRKISVSSLPTIALILIVSFLSLPIAIELIRSLASLFISQSDTSIAEIFFRSDRILLLIRSIAIACLIALVGMCMGIPLGRMLTSNQKPLLLAVLLSPLWLPAIMLYAAGNLMRAPDTWLGSMIVSYSTSSPDLRWITIWIGYAVAVLGLAIWSAPIAAVLIASGLGTRSNLYNEMIALEPVGIIRRAWLWMRIYQRVLFRAWILIAVLMLGSAVPMHLAQLETWSIVIWRQLAERSPEQWGIVWLSSWPTIFIAAIGAWVLTKAVITQRESSSTDDRGHTAEQLPKAVVLLALAVWALGALLPLVAMFITLDDLGSILHFWKIQSAAVRDSGLIALFTGLFTFLVALLVAITLANPSRTSRKLGAICVLSLCILGLIPGVLVGAAVARLPIDGFTSTWFATLLASCIRTSFLGAIVGSLCASSESIERQSIRWQLAGPSLVGWFQTRFPSIFMPLLGSGLIGMIYSFSEIEAAIMVRSPSMHNLPQQLLSDLHYARLEQLSAAGINIIVFGLLFSVVGSLLLSKRKD